MRSFLHLFRRLRLGTSRRTPPNRPAPPARHRATPHGNARDLTRPNLSRPAQKSSFTGSSGSPGRTNAAGHYRSAAYRPICAGRVRQRQFNRSRHGLDPTEVAGFLHQVADELSALRAELTQTYDENARLKDALRTWQSQFGPRVVRR